jgi:DNA transformation protein and related proteins
MKAATHDTLPTALVVQPVSALRNLGAKSGAMLVAAGINSADELRRLGAVKAYLMVKRSGAKPSLNLLWAMEGALTDTPWQEVAREHRLSLLMALEAMEGYT